MLTLKEEAEYQRLALAMGLTDIDSVVAWADQKIVSLPEPPIQVIDVSLTGSRPAHAVMELLAQFPGNGDLTTVAHQVLALFRQRFLKGDVPVALAVDQLSAYSNRATIPRGEWAEVCDFRLYFFEIQEGIYGTLDHLKEHIMTFANKYAGKPLPA
ncbi:MAG: hypothetical protein K1X53_17525 [Candidatus Sumerlaeaceae bacterium]|nr:hypothetical protein [Candidatus Sumerlaeaceae bacterium]